MSLCDYQVTYFYSKRAEIHNVTESHYVCHAVYRNFRKWSRVGLETRDRCDETETVRSRPRPRPEHVETETGCFWSRDRDRDLTSLIGICAI